MLDMKIGAGSAPGAQLIGLRVFGCQGSTNLTGAALDRALDPNGDGIYDDRADIINLSLGSDFGLEDDPENTIIEALTRQGILSVVAAGNSMAAGGNGDTYSIAGSPSNAVSALAVANSIGSILYKDKAEVVAPAELAGLEIAGNYSIRYPYETASEEALTGEVIMAPEDNKYGCSPYAAGTNFEGKWVFVEWDIADQTQLPCSSINRFAFAQRAGAKGIIMASTMNGDNSGIAGTPTLPGIRLTKDSADAVRKAAAEGTLKIKLDPANRGKAVVNSGQLDQVNPSTVRGIHGAWGLTKPDVAAPRYHHHLSRCRAGRWFHHHVRHLHGDPARCRCCRARAPG